MADPIADRMEVALRLADETDRCALARYQVLDLRVEVKADGSPVTEVDLACDDLLHDGIARAFPDDGVLSEERDERQGRSGFRWVLDPIDGTSSLARGVPLFSTLIGIERDGEPMAGVASMPALGERVWGRRGAGASWRRRDGSVVPARVSVTPALAEATIEAASATAFVKSGVGETYLALARASKKLRGWSEGVAFAFVATGRIDAGVSMGMSRWDVAAFVPIVGEAGGLLTGWAGEPAVGARRMVAANPAIHAQVRGVLGA